jgi:hypothetical protein
MQTVNATSRVGPRFHPRVRASFMVKLSMDGRMVIAKARDLSMAGLYLIGIDSELGRTLPIRLPLPRDREISTTCRVKRRYGDGVAVELAPLDWDDLFALARYLHPRLP